MILDLCHDLLRALYDEWMSVNDAASCGTDAQLEDTDAEAGDDAVVSHELYLAKTLVVDHH